MMEDARKAIQEDRYQQFMEETLAKFGDEKVSNGYKFI